MKKLDRRNFILASLGATLAAPRAFGFGRRLPAPLTLDASKPVPAPVAGELKMGAATNPAGVTVTVDSRSLLVGGRRAMPVMGEFHYSRYPENEWREELLKMKAGGIDIVATYVFWIHHEEREGVFDWSGRRDLRRFVELAREAGLLVVVRLGPWCHGEVRNGGLPDWVLKKPFKPRTDAPEYLAAVTRLYGETGAQLKGLWWKDGGPIIGAQFENEFKGRAEHLLNLKRIARAAGVDAPLYTRTAWHGMASPLPFGEILPLFGAYAEGFWDRELTPMPGKYGDGFLFRTARTDASIATDQLGAKTRRDAEDVDAYPYFCCEIGGGMMPSYHRRILNYPKDIESIALVKLGSGSNLQGFYMYHGGTNPDGALSTLQESQATNYWNDMPVKSYDFQAPLREFGQLSPHYHALRLQNMFLRDFGPELAAMPALMPDRTPSDSNDAETLRWSARTNGASGFVFVNNYQRLKQMPAKTGVRFAIRLRDETLTFPDRPLTVGAGALGIFPFNLKVGGDGLIRWATLQPLCRLDEAGTEIVFLREIDGIEPSISFGDGTRLTGRRERSPGMTAEEATTPSGRKFLIVTVRAGVAESLWKTTFDGAERVFATRAGLVVDGDEIRLSGENAAELAVALRPPPGRKLTGSNVRPSKTAGFLTRFAAAPPPAAAKKTLKIRQLQPAGPPREIRIGGKGVAEAPADGDFDAAAVWRIELPKGALARRALIRVRYEGDVARAYVGERLLTDNFYNGSAFEFAVDRDLAEIREKGVTLKILPLRADAPIYLADEAKPKFGGAASVCRLVSAELVEIREATFKLDRR